MKILALETSCDDEPMSGGHWRTEADAFAKIIQAKARQRAHSYDTDIKP